MSNQFHDESTHLNFKTTSLNIHSAVKAMPKK